MTVYDLGSRNHVVYDEETDSVIKGNLDDLIAQKQAAQAVIEDIDIRGDDVALAAYGLRAFKQSDAFKRILKKRQELDELNTYINAIRDFRNGV